MIVRKAVPSDFESYFKLETDFMRYNNAHSEKWYNYSISKRGLRLSFLRKLRKKESIFLLALDEEKPIGYFHGYIERKDGNGYHPGESRVGYLENVFILKDQRGKGIFSAFMKGFISFLRKQRIKHCALHVDIKNDIAIKAYEKFGFNVQEYKMIAKI